VSPAERLALTSAERDALRAGGCLFKQSRSGVTVAVGAKVYGLPPTGALVRRLLLSAKELGLIDADPQSGLLLTFEGGGDVHVVGETNT
jgi:hypothetical protein